MDFKQCFDTGLEIGSVVTNVFSSIGVSMFVSYYFDPVPITKTGLGGKFQTLGKVVACSTVASAINVKCGEAIQDTADTIREVLDIPTKTEKEIDKTLNEILDDLKKDKELMEKDEDLQKELRDFIDKFETGLQEELGNTFEADILNIEDYHDTEPKEEETDGIGGDPETGADED